MQRHHGHEQIPEDHVQVQESLCCDLLAMAVAGTDRIQTQLSLYCDLLAMTVSRSKLTFFDLSEKVVACPRMDLAACS